MDGRQLYLWYMIFIKSVNLLAFHHRKEKNHCFFRNYDNCHFNSSKVQQLHHVLPESGAIGESGCV